MADYSIPLQVQTPQPFATLNNVLGTAQGIQSLQQQQIGLQVARQANLERQNVVNAIQNKDPDLTPDATGLVDQGRATAKLQQLAPQTYNQYVQNIATSNQKNVELNNSLEALSQNARKDMGEALLPTIGAPLSHKVDAVNDWMDTANTPQARKVGNQFIASLGKGAKSKDDGGDDGDAIARNAATRANAITDQINARTAGLSLVQQGSQAQAVVTQPGLSGLPQMSKVGEPIPMQVSPGQKESIEQDPVTKQAIVVRRGADGTIISARPAAGLSANAPPAPGAAGGPRQGPFTPIPQGETVDTLAQLQSSRMASNLAARQTGEMQSNNKQILDLLKAGTTTGSNAPFVRDWMTKVGLQWSNNDGANLNNISHFLALQSQANERTMGVNTDAGRETSGLASGTVTMDPRALASATKANDALTTGVGVFNRGLETAIGKNGIGAARTFQNQWSNNFDPVVYRYANAIRDGDDAEKARIEKQYGKPTSGAAAPDSTWGRFVAKMQNLHQLEQNGQVGP